jgi:hypothetical protein
MGHLVGQAQFLDRLGRLAAAADGHGPRIGHRHHPATAEPTGQANLAVCASCPRCRKGACPPWTLLANWLATTFPNLYGAAAGSNSLMGNTNGEVARFYQKLFAMPSPLDARALGVALDIYARTQSLGGSAAAPFGFTVTAYGLGAYDFNIGTNGAAFDVPNQTTLNVYQTVRAVNRKAVNGVLYPGDQTLRDLAENVFAGIDREGALL